MPAVLKIYFIKKMERNRGGGMCMCNRVSKIGCFSMLIFFFKFSLVLKNIFYQNAREKSRWWNVQSCEKDWLFSGDRALAA